MFKNKPVTLLITAGFILLLIAAAGVYPLVFGNMRSGGPGFINSGTRPQMQGYGQFPSDGSMPSGGNPPSGLPSTRSGQQDGQTSGNRQFTQGGTDGNFSGTIPTGTGVTLKLMQLLQVIQKAGAIIIIVLGILALLGVFLGKDWGRKLAITTAIFGILFSAAGFFGFVFGLSLWIKIAALIISIAIVVLSSLSKSRIQATVPA
jgi:hypothetical protein